MFEKKELVIYLKTNQFATILDVHLEDIEPYYSIKLNENQKEIQTIAKYLKKIDSSIKKNKTRKRRRFGRKKTLKNIKNQ